jgi:hypothetical protein
VIIAIVVLELIGCFFITLLLAAGNGKLPIAPLQVWLVCAVLQLAIHYLPRRPYVRIGLALTVTLMLFASVGLEGAAAVPYFHQTLFVAAAAAVPQIWWELFAKATASRVLVLALIALFSLPLGFTAWSLANIVIVKAKAWSVSRGEPYCILLSNGSISYGGGYHRAPNLWSLNGWNMFSVRGVGGSGDCCQWDFHALLVIEDNQLFNWSYDAQRFERISEQTRRNMSLNQSCC